MRGMVSAGLIVALASSAIAQTEPVKPEATDSDVVAVVLGREITVKQRKQLNGLVFGALLQKFAEDNQIKPTEEELDAFVRKTEEKKKQHQAELEQDRIRLKKELASATLPARDRKEKESQLAIIERILTSTQEVAEQTKGMEEMKRQAGLRIAQGFVTRWKINKALFEKYGGRVIFQQAGVEPLDAYRDFLKEQEKKGAFQITDKQCEADFWRYFTNENMHTFYDREEGAKLMETPWWMKETPAEE
jgi:hypothetical protein